MTSAACNVPTAPLAQNLLPIDFNRFLVQLAQTAPEAICVARGIRVADVSYTAAGEASVRRAIASPQPGVAPSVQALVDATPPRLTEWLKPGVDAPASLPTLDQCLQRAGARWAILPLLQFREVIDGVDVESERLGPLRRRVLARPVLDLAAGAGHAGLLVISVPERTVERFEPNGAGYTGPVQDLDGRTLAFLRALPGDPLRDFRYLTPLEYSPRVGPAAAQARAIPGSCGWWSLYYLALRTQNPDVARDCLIRWVLRLDPQRIYDEIVRFRDAVLQGAQPDVRLTATRIEGPGSDRLVYDTPADAAQALSGRLQFGATDDSLEAWSGFYAPLVRQYESSAGTTPRPNAGAQYAAIHTPIVSCRDEIAHDVIAMLAVWLVGCPAEALHLLPALRFPQDFECASTWADALEIPSMVYYLVDSAIRTRTADAAALTAAARLLAEFGSEMSPEERSAALNDLTDRTVALVGTAQRAVATTAYDEWRRILCTVDPQSGAFAQAADALLRRTAQSRRGAPAASVPTRAMLPFGPPLVPIRTPNLYTHGVLIGAGSEGAPMSMQLT